MIVGGLEPMIFQPLDQRADPKTKPFVILFGVER